MTKVWIPGKSSLNFSIALVAILLAGSTIFFSATLYNSERDRTFDEYLARMGRETTRLALDADSRISTLSLAVTTVAQHIRQSTRADRYSQTLGTLHPFLVDITRDLHTLRTIVVTDATGKITDDLRLGQPARGIDVSDRKYFTIHKETAYQGVYVAEPVVSRVDSKWTWPFTIAARDEDGRLLAVVVGSVDDRYFGRLLTNPVSSSELQTLLVHRNGTTLQTSESLRSKMGKKITNTNLIEEAETQGAVASKLGRAPFGHIESVVFATKVGNWPVFVTNELDREVIEETLEGTYQFTVLFSGIASLTILAAALLQIRYNHRRTIIESELRESNQQFQDFATAASDWMWEMDENLRFSSVPIRFETATGRKLESVIGKTRWEIVDADLGEEKWRMHRNDMEEHKPFRDFQYDIPDKNWLVFNQTVHGLIAPSLILSFLKTLLDYQMSVSNSLESLQLLQLRFILI